MHWVDFAAVKQAVSLETVLGRYAVAVHRTHRHQVAGCCPIHGGQREDSFRVDLAQGVFHCFACQAGGNVLDLVAAMEKCSIWEAARRLQRWYALPEGPVPRAQERAAKLVREEESKRAREEEQRNVPLRFTLRGVDPYHPYLRQRGIDPATAIEFGVGFYGSAGLLSGRIVIPICNRAGELVAYAGRAIDGRPPKYKLPSGFRKGLELFNFHRAVAKTAPPTGRAIVVEGFFDCLKVHQAGYRNVVALMGASLSEKQSELLKTRFREWVVMLDGDEAGRRASWAPAARWPASYLAWVPGGRQPDQLSKDEIQRILRGVARCTPGA